ncbi:glycosyltransferase family 2 protein [Shewanella cyperi]|uniref:Glycosyltransferase family 2 protein n=1 Tax=Shewanella cyperi TaxID=2814292 RepID=A0A974XIA9_9GAMM|nr:glycosyltransferase family A protein [Shewanella cyperi]QSX28911.1 glycosyltransferase family 2 protein [Shewanella cyperi]
MKFSLILCTLGRDRDVGVFLSSLLKQQYDNYELIIVDQNKDDRVSNILDDFTFPEGVLKYIRQNIPGLSRARNVGLNHASGDIIAFPDDDCLYDDDVLQSVADFFVNEAGKYKVLTVNTRDNSTGKSLITMPDENCELNRTCLLGCSFTLFFDKDAASQRFDERLGVGSGFIWGASEEHDYLYRFLQEGTVGYFLKNVFVFHPAKEEEALDTHRAYYYGAGLAAFRIKYFSRWRVIKSAALILTQIFTNLFIGHWRKSIFKCYFFCGYVMGCVAWRLSIR